jgi:hypothetical protein
VPVPQSTGGSRRYASYPGLARTWRSLLQRVSLLSMKRIAYAGETLVTSDDVADALTELASALGTAQKSETVEIPVFEEDGSYEMASLVIGPASELVAVPVGEPGTEPDTKAAVAELRKLQETLARRHRDLGPGADVPDADPTWMNQI